MTTLTGTMTAASTPPPVIGVSERDGLIDTLERLPHVGLVSKP